MSAIGQMPALQTEPIHIDTASIPEFRRREIATAVLASLERALSVPGAEEEFQAWLKEYRQKKKAAPAAQRKE